MLFVRPTHLSEKFPAAFQLERYGMKTILVLAGDNNWGRQTTGPFTVPSSE